MSKENLRTVGTPSIGLEERLDRPIRRERVLVLLTPEELKRVDKFQTAMKIPYRSELFRAAVFAQVELWEQSQGGE